MNQDILAMDESIEVYESLKDVACNGDVDEILQSCKAFIRWHIADVNEFMSK